MYYDQYVHMQEVKRITANIPEKLLQEASGATGKGITETIILGLKLLKRTRAYDKAQKLRGKVKIDLDLRISRERNRC